MSEKTHTGPDAGITSKPWTLLLWLPPLWLGLLILIYLMAHAQGAILERLARTDPDRERRQKVDGLLVTRALLKDPASGGETLWAGRRSGAPAGFFLGGAVRAERLGRPAEARLWLGMELLARGRAKEARAMLDSVPTSAPLALPEIKDWENSEVGKRLRKSLGKLD